MRKSDEVKVNDVVELHGLLSSIDLLAENGYEVHDIFKDLMFEDSEPDQNLSPSRILIHKICADMQKNASDFLTEGKSMGSITDYKSENNNQNSGKYENEMVGKMISESKEKLFVKQDTKKK